MATDKRFPRVVGGSLAEKTVMTERTLPAGTDVPMLPDMPCKKNLDGSTGVIEALLYSSTSCSTENSAEV
jgi:hypothetical protein